MLIQKSCLVHVDKFFPPREVKCPETTDSCVKVRSDWRKETTNVNFFFPNKRPSSLSTSMKIILFRLTWKSLFLIPNSSSDASELYLIFERWQLWPANCIFPLGVIGFKLFHELKHSPGSDHDPAKFCPRSAHPGIWPSRGSAMGVFPRQVRAAIFC